jgi:hypothetical protein
MFNTLLIGTVGIIAYYFYRKKKKQKKSDKPNSIKPRKKITKSRTKKTDFKRRMAKGLIKGLAKGVKFLVEDAVEFAKEKFAEIVEIATKKSAELIEYAIKYWYYTTGIVTGLAVTATAIYVQPPDIIKDPRFEEYYGTVFDNQTHLIWLQNTNCANKKRDWETALKDIKQLNEQGTMNNNDCGDNSKRVSNKGGSHQTDWRLPDLKELQSLLAPPKRLKFSDDESVFPNVMNDYYWSSSLFYEFGNPDTEQVWYIHLNSSDINIINIEDKSARYYVWAVRGNRRWWVEHEEE